MAPRATVSDEWVDNEKVKRILKEHLDETDYRIYKALNEDGRMSDTQIGERVGLSLTAALPGGAIVAGVVMAHAMFVRNPVADSTGDSTRVRPSRSAGRSDHRSSRRSHAGEASD
jgi:hypothetical protein